MAHPNNIRRLKRTATRQDLLMVGTGAIPTDFATPADPADPEATLRGMGFRVQRPHLNHWVLTTSRPLPELHFYSRIELHRFVNDRAVHYQAAPVRQSPIAAKAGLSG